MADFVFRGRGAGTGWIWLPGGVAAGRSRGHSGGMPYHDPSGDVLAFRQFCRIADRIEADPALLAVPLANIARWLERGHWAKRELNQWRDWILEAQRETDGMERLLRLLRDDGEEAREWKGFDPFAGLLTAEEMEPLLWMSRH